VYSTTSPKGGSIMTAWHKDVDVLMYLCSLDSACAGFNSNGKLMLDASNRVATPGVTLYVKK
jgi:hypothetical protein